MAKIQRQKLRACVIGLVAAIVTFIFPFQLKITEDVSWKSGYKKHYPRRFSTDTKLNIDRGLNIVNCWTGQRIASWIYSGSPSPYSCSKHGCDSWSGNETPKKFLYHANDTSILQANDSLFVSFNRLEEFVADFLPSIRVDVVLITTPWHLVTYPSEGWMKPLGANITSHPHILGWFVKWVGWVTEGLETHSKVHSFPLGLKPKMGKADFRNPIPTYRRAFLESFNGGQPKNKSQLLYLSPLRPTNNVRSVIFNQYENLNGRKSNLVGYSEYLSEISASHYVLSPDGDNPDCHRHYEAIGLGAIPITQLDPQSYDHLQEADINGVLYENTHILNVSALQQHLKTLPLFVLNRNMIFEEYYMEYIEQKIGRPLRWWDVVKAEQCTLNNFAVISSLDLN